MIKRTVCQVVPRLNSGGVERGTVDIAKALVEAGYGSVVISEGGRLVFQLEQNGTQVITLPVASKNPFLLYGNIRSLIQAVQNVKGTLIHARSRAPAWSSYFVAKRLGIPFITTYHGTYNAAWFGKKLYNRIMCLGDVVIAPSQFIKDHIIATYGQWVADRIQVIHRGVDLNVFSSQKVSTQRRQEVRLHWGITDPDAFVWLLPGRFTRWKGHLDFIRALHMLIQQNPQRPIYGVLLGEKQENTPYVTEINQLIQRLGMVPYLKMLNVSDDMPAQYLACDAVVVPSTDPEAFGRVMAEAHAMGRLVVSTNHGGAREIVLPEETGWLVPPRDVNRLFDAFKACVALSLEERNRWEQNARHHVEQNFTLEQMQQKTLALYESILSKY